jgi:MFS family permease
MLGRFPRVFWILVAADASRALGSGLWVPYWALYLTQELDASEAQAGALIAVAGGMGLVGAPLGGYLADRIGRRPTILLGLAIGSAGMLAYGTASSLLLLAVITPLWAVSSDIESPATSAAIADLVEPRLRTEAFGLKRQAQNVFFALGPPLGAAITLVLSMQWLFILAALATAIFLVIVLVAVPETRVAAEQNEERVHFGVALRDRALLLLAVGTGLGTIVYVQFDSVLGVFLHEERGYAIATWGFLFGINPILVALLQYPIARWAGRRSARAVLTAGVLLEGVALFALWPGSPVPLLVAAIVVLALGEMLVAPVAAAVAAALAPTALRGSYQGILDLGFAVSFAPGTFVGLWLVGAGHGELMLALALPLAAVGALCFLRLPSRPMGSAESVTIPEAALP